MATINRITDVDIATAAAMDDLDSARRKNAREI
jgi:hypothetical protein